MNNRRRTIKRAALMKGSVMHVHVLHTLRRLEQMKANQPITDQMITYYVSKGGKKGLSVEEMLDKWRDGIREPNEPEPDEVEDDEEDDDYAYDGYDDYYY